MIASIANTEARNRVGKALQVYFRNSIRTSPDGCEWIETGTQSVHLGELALRLVEASGPPPESDTLMAQLEEIGKVR